MAEIKPPIVLNFTPPAGGAASRFGIEDNTSDVDRVVNFGAHELDVVSGTADYSGVTSEIYLRAGNVLTYTQSDANNYASTRIGSNNVTTAAKSGSDQRKLILTPYDWLLIKNGLDAEPIHVPVSVNNAFADAAGNITLPKGQFADNAAALAGGLAVNDIYHTAGVLKIVI